MGLKSRMSSANIVSLDPLVSGREHAQFIYTRNNSGPKTEPWGTPDVTGVVSEDALSTTTNCFLSQR